MSRPTFRRRELVIEHSYEDDAIHFREKHTGTDIALDRHEARERRWTEAKFRRMANVIDRMLNR